MRPRFIHCPDFCVRNNEIGRRLCLGHSHEVAHEKDQRMPQKFGNPWQFWHFWQAYLSPHLSLVRNTSKNDRPVNLKSFTLKSDFLQTTTSSSPSGVPTCPSTVRNACSLVTRILASMMAVSFTTSGRFVSA